jgi:hypothetical protein
MADNKRHQGKSERGFASMREDERREIARSGGGSVPDEKVAAHRLGGSYLWRVAVVFQAARSVSPFAPECFAQWAQQ